MKLIIQQPRDAYLEVTNAKLLELAQYSKGSGWADAPDSISIVRETVDDPYDTVEDEVSLVLRRDAREGSYLD